MNIRWSLVLSVLLVLACSSDPPETGDVSGADVSGEDGSDPGGDEGTDPGTDSVTPDEGADVSPPPAGCETDDECVTSPYGTQVESEADCGCTICWDTPVSKAVHEARKAAWEEHCTTWAEENPCPTIACEDPGPAACKAGECVMAWTACVQEVPKCNLPQPNCAPPLVPAVKGDCWSCGYLETCTCSDGPATCDVEPPTCPLGTELAEQGGCYACVDPISCEEVSPPTSTCKEPSDCTMSPFSAPIASTADCYCPFCSDFPLSKTEHQARQESWELHCEKWVAEQPCPDHADCPVPPEVTCEAETCKPVAP